METLRPPYNFIPSNGPDAPEVFEPVASEVFEPDAAEDFDIYKPSCTEIVCSCFTGRNIYVYGLTIVLMNAVVLGGGYVGLYYLPSYIVFVAVGLPYVLFISLASIIFGGKSVDRCQNMLLMLVAVVLIYCLKKLVMPQRALEGLRTLDDGNAACEKLWSTTFGTYVSAQNQTLSGTNRPCWGVSLADALGAVPEEIVKWLTLALFIGRGWVADPFAVVVYSFVIGTTFGAVETLFQNNLLSMNLYGLWERVFQCQTVVHGTAAMMTGLLLAQRKFLFSHKYGGISCCEVTGPRPSLVVLAPAIVYHFANNFLGKLSSTPSEAKLLANFHLVAVVYLVGPMYLRYLWMTLKYVPKVNVAKLQQMGDLPGACEYICCCQCESSDNHDRRYVSVLQMGEDRELLQYSPPVHATEV
jgi:hypothetical protein